jgi:hypothetical protein
MNAKNLLLRNFRFGAPLTSLSSSAILVLMTVPNNTCADNRAKVAPLCVLQMYVYVVSYCFGEISACIPCCFLVYGNIFPFAPISTFFSFNTSDDFKQLLKHIIYQMHA